MTILPPVYLKEQIRERTKCIAVQSTVTARRASSKMQMFWYSLKVSGAVAMSLVVLFLTGVIQRDKGELAEAVEEKSAYAFLIAADQTANNLTGQMSDFANKLLNWNFDKSGGQ